MTSADINTIILLLPLAIIVIFLMGKQAGSTEADDRQRRLMKVRGRINGLDPGQVTDHLLNTVESALPDREK